MLKDLYKKYSDLVAFVTLYVREAHPGDRYPQPKSMEQKMQYARIYKGRDDIPWPVAVDDLDGTLHQQLGTLSNGAYIMNIDGNVAFRSLASNDKAVLERGLEAISRDPHAIIGESQPKVVPMLAGMGDLYEMLEFSGGHAKEDIREQTPALYGLSRLAGVLRPLPPFWRSIAAIAITAAGLGLLVAGLDRWVARSAERGMRSAE